MNNPVPEGFTLDDLRTLILFLAAVAGVFVAAVWIVFPFKVLSRMSKMQASLDSIDKRLSGAIVTQDS